MTQRNEDLVNLSEAERAMGVKAKTFRAHDERKRNGSVSTMPDPVIVGRSVRLFSLTELTAWWANREDGRALWRSNKGRSEDR